MKSRMPLFRGALVLIAVGVASCLAWGAKKSSKKLVMPDGRPIRKIYVHVFSPAEATAIQAQLLRDTCLTPVPQSSQADAELNLSVALPSGDGPSLSVPNVFAPPTGPQTLAKSNAPDKSESFNCTEGKGGKNCTGSYDIPAGDIADMPASGEAAGSGSGVDISLVTIANPSQELWEPHGKQRWTDQLRAAVGCPVCPGEHFNRRRDTTYSQWIEQRCKDVRLADVSANSH